MLHCPADCHEHTVESATGVGGTFPAPEHPYPSHIELRLSATDSNGTTVTTSRELYPRAENDPGRHRADRDRGLGGRRGGHEPEHDDGDRGVGRDRHPAAPQDASAASATGSRAGPTAPSAAATSPSCVDTSLVATYVTDAHDTCAAATSASTGSWRSEHASGNGDVDWFRYTIAKGHRVVLTAGDLPANARLDLYSSCSKRLATADASSGTRFEELTKSPRCRHVPGQGLRSRAAAGATRPYVIRFRPLPGGTPVKSSQVTQGAGGGGIVRIAGEVSTTAGHTTGMATVKATFRNASGTIVRTLTTRAFAPRLGDGEVSPFVLRGAVPALRLDHLPGDDRQRSTGRGRSASSR